MTLVGALLILLLVVIYTAQSLLTRYYSASSPVHEDLASSVFTIISGLTAALFSLALTGFSFAPEPLTLLFGVLNASALMLYNASMIKASTSGPYSITMVSMIAGGIVIPAIVAACFGDDLSPVKIVAILGVLVSVYLIAKKSGESYQNKKMFWISCLCLAIGNGVYGSFLDVQQRITGVDDKEELITITYFLAALFSFFVLLAKEKRGTLKAFRQTKKSCFFLIAASLVVASAVSLLVYIISLVDTTILYTLDNSSVFLLSVLFSCIFLREKLSRMNIIGCITLCASLVCMSLSPQIMDWIVSLL